MSLIGKKKQWSSQGDMSLATGSLFSRNGNSREDVPTSIIQTPLRRYFSHRKPRYGDLLPTPDFVGMYSLWAVLWGSIFLIVPVSYIYIGLILLREMCRLAPVTIFEPLEHFLPLLAKLIEYMHSHSYIVVEYWCWLEGVVYIVFKIRLAWLQNMDPLEASLSAAPFMDAPDRELLWTRMMKGTLDIVGFFEGWFFETPITTLTQDDVIDFCAWSMFEGRHQEHLTASEVQQLEEFAQEAQIRISLQLYGSLDKDDKASNDRSTTDSDDGTEDSTKDGVSDTEEISANEEAVQLHPEIIELCRKRQLPLPKKLFQYASGSSPEENSFFSHLYESYKVRYDQMIKSMPQPPTDFHPVQDFKEFVLLPDFHPVQDLKDMVKLADTSVKTLMAETAQTLSQAEETAMATASHMYESLIPSGSHMDKQLTAMRIEITEAWNSVKNIRHLETARFLSKQRQRIRQQLKGYRIMLTRMREMSGVPAKQMAVMMRRITECNEAMEHLESRAQTAFVQATGFARKNLKFLQRNTEPRHYAKYSSDPLLGIATYPLGFNILLFGLTEGPLRVMMSRRGFERRVVGAVSYYYHPGLNATSADEEFDNDDVDSDPSQTPIIFVHGIGIGLIIYMDLIDALLATGRPIFLPEIPYVSGFRPWQSTNAVLAPAAVVSTMTAMLATHGYMRGVWLGHSYGTSWLSYMIKYANHAVSAVLFLDPICFCLHMPRLTKQFVYTQPDPGTISYIVRTDVIVNWTIQRSFPWTWIILFAEQINVPCSVYLSEKDALVPSEHVQEYFRQQPEEIPICDFDGVPESHFSKPFHCTVFRGDGHGGWSERQSVTVPVIVSDVVGLCRHVEAKRTS